MAALPATTPIMLSSERRLGAGWPSGMFDVPLKPRKGDFTLKAPKFQYSARRFVPPAGMAAAPLGGRLAHDRKKEGGREREGQG